MYSVFPRRHQVSIRLTLSLAWLLAAGGGLSALTVSPLSLIVELGPVVTHLWAVGLMIASAIALLGVAMNKYRFEWVAAWLAAVGLFPYVTTIWWLVSIGQTGHLTQAFMLSSLLVFMVLRANFCSAHAARLRSIHVETGSTRVLD